MTKRKSGCPRKITGRHNRVIKNNSKQNPFLSLNQIKMVKQSLATDRCKDHTKKDC